MQSQPSSKRRLFSNILAGSMTLMLLFGLARAWIENRQMQSIELHLRAEQAKLESELAEEERFVDYVAERRKESTENSDQFFQVLRSCNSFDDLPTLESEMIIDAARPASGVDDARWIYIPSGSHQLVLSVVRSEPKSAAETLVRTFPLEANSWYSLLYKTTPLGSANEKHQLSIHLLNARSEEIFEVELPGNASSRSWNNVQNMIYFPNEVDREALVGTSPKMLQKSNHLRNGTVTFSGSRGPDTFRVDCSYWLESSTPAYFASPDVLGWLSDADKRKQLKYLGRGKFEVRAKLFEDQVIPD